MRYAIVVTLALVFGIPTAAALQTRTPELWITIKPSGIPGGSAAIPVLGSELYIEGPTAGVGVPGKAGILYSIRAWKEGQKARVVVYAMLDDKRAPGGHTETPIATISVGSGEAVTVNAAEKWGGAPLAISADLR